MNPSEIEPKETAEAVGHVLLTLEVEPGDAIVHADGAAILVATPIGLLKISDSITSRVDQAWKMTAEVIPWTDVWPQVTIGVERGKRLEGMLTQWTVALGGRGGEVNTSSGAEAGSAGLPSRLLWPTEGIGPAQHRLASRSLSQRAMRDPGVIDALDALERYAGGIRCRDIDGAFWR